MALPAAPGVRNTLPPVAALLPAASTTDPPEPLPPCPTTTLMAPPLPLPRSPVDMTMPPLLPDETSPDPMKMAPESPDDRAGAVATEIDPEPALTLEPDEMAITPPDDVIAFPAESVTAPPAARPSVDNDRPPKMYTAAEEVPLAEEPAESRKDPPSPPAEDEPV